MMPIRYFSEGYHFSDAFDKYEPLIQESVSVYDDPRENPNDKSSLPTYAKTGYMEVKHYPSKEIPNIYDVNKDEPAEELFSHRPAKTQIIGAFVDPSLRHTIPIIGAYFARKYGELTADSHLSDFSSKFTRNAIAKGLPVKPHHHNPDAESSDDPWDDKVMEERTGIVPNTRPGSCLFQEEIHKSEIYEAKNYLREALGRKKPLSQQFAVLVDHPKLPDMGGY